MAGIATRETSSSSLPPLMLDAAIVGAGVAGFLEDLHKGWSWSRKFPAQPEIECWMQYTEGFDAADLKTARPLLSNLCRLLRLDGPETAPAPCTNLPP